MMHRRDIALVWTTLLLASACDGTEPPRDPPQPATVTVTPATATLTALDDTVQLTARVRDQYGETMTGISVAWSSGNTQVASVDAAGLATAVGNGAATITATAGTVSGTAKVTVEQVLSSISISAAADSMVHGDTLRFTAEGADANGHAMEGIDFTWASSDTRVATVDDDGLATGAGPGNAEISAASSGVTGGTELLVVPRVPTTVAVTPDSVTFAALADTTRMTAEVRDQIGRVMSGFAVAWTSGDTTVASVDSAGLAAAVGNGTAAVTATADTASATAEVTVRQVLTAVSVSPAADSIVRGDTLRFSAQGTDANGYPVAGIEFSWASNDKSVATVDSTGLTTGVRPGNARITATSSPVTGTAELSVTERRVPRSVRVTPFLPELHALGDTVRLTAEVTDQHGNVMPGFPVVWRSLDTIVVTVDSTGLATAKANTLRAEISATADSVMGKAWLSIQQHAAHITVSPAADTLFPGGHFTLVGHAVDANGHSMPGARFQWTSTNESVAAVYEGSGYMRALAEGATTIIAARDGVQGRSEITVLANPDRPPLVALYNATDGPRWIRQRDWLTDAPLRHWESVTTDRKGRVTALVLNSNRMTGTLPPELGDLSQLRQLWLQGNALTTPIPPDIGSLKNLEHLLLHANSLTGPIPGFLANLTNLTHLWLAHNKLTGTIPPDLAELRNLISLQLFGNELIGSIPPALGDMSSLQGLFLSDNRLTGTVPPELGDLEHLEVLDVGTNDLQGTLPEELSDLSRLEELILRHNPRLTGPLPDAFTSLRRLQIIIAGDTGLCAPANAAFKAWLNRLLVRRIRNCDANAKAYLTQAVQSRDYPVPLVADRDALLRVFVTATKKTSQGIPDVIARFYRDDKETFVDTIPGKSTPIPTEVDEGSLSKSANAVVPDSIVQPDLEMVIEIDPEGTLHDSLGVPKRIPETGRLSVDVLAVPLLDLTVVPFLYSEDPDSSIIDLAEDMEDDPEGHELLDLTRILLPVGDLEISAHSPVTTSTNDIFKMLAETEALHKMEDAEGHYKGMMAGGVSGGPLGVALLGGKVSFSVPRGFVMAHELGHNFFLLHAPCGNPPLVDFYFPQRDGSIGAWGYDQRGDSLVEPKVKDLMSYCYPSWISDYNFSVTIRRRAVAELERRRGTAATVRKSLLLWGGVDGDGAPFLEPAVVVTAPSAPAGEYGDYQLTGKTAEGDQLFSFRFAAEEIADGDGRKLFAFVIPVEPGWPGSLAAITLSGPEGSVTLGAETDRSVVIWRDSRTGQVRGFLRDLSPEAVVRTRAALLARDPGLDVFVSGGIPDADAWRR